METQPTDPTVPPAGGVEPQRIPIEKFVWGGFGLLLIGVVIAALFYHEPPRELPVWREVADFSFVNQDGETVERDDLIGRIWVADFIFTSCAQACPGMTARLREIQDAVQKDAVLREEVRLVSFSLDPARDTPEALKRFGGGFGADFDSWWFLTGRAGEVARLCQESFQLSAGSAAGEAPASPALHSDRFALVDRRGRIRAYYQPTAAEEDLKQLLADIVTLAGQPK